MTTALLFTKEFLGDIRFSINTPSQILSIFVLYWAIGVVHQFQSDQPKSERFFFALGITSHWFATFIGRCIDTMREEGMIKVSTAHFCTSMNLVTLVFAAGVFYTRALTQHLYPNLWKWTAGIYVFLVVVLYTLRAVNFVEPIYLPF